jgi:hypothetical protein
VDEALVLQLLINILLSVGLQPNVTRVEKDLPSSA